MRSWLIEKMPAASEDTMTPRRSLLVLATLAACGGGSTTPDAMPPLAAPADRAALFTAGPYPVGYRTASITYRPDGVDEDRTLELNLWYPAAAGTGAPAVYSVAGLLAVPREGLLANADERERTARIQGAFRKKILKCLLPLRRRGKFLR
jgi:hypothetical protein